MLSYNSFAKTLAIKPSGQVTFDKIIIDQVRISLADSGEFFGLSSAKCLMGVEAPDAFEQTLAAQDFMAPGNAPGKFMGHIEQGAVAIGDFRI
jgi:hypothetical protein